jgi:integrase
MSHSNRLNALQVTKLSEPGRYGDGGGLYLRVAEYEVKGGQRARSKNWVFRFERDGRERQMGLGSLDTLSLADARTKARDCRKALLDGADPINVRRANKLQARLAAARGLTFKACGQAYIEEHRKGWKNDKHAAQWPATLESHVYPVIGDLMVADIDTDLVLKCLRPIWDSVPDTAARVRGRIEKVLDWAKARECRSGENPARWRGHLDNLLTRKSKAARIKHHPALPYVDLPALMGELRSRTDISSRTLEFLILNATRTTETIGARWSEIDLVKKLWTIPPERMKGGREHIAPLSDRAVEILKSLPRKGEGDGFVFPGREAEKPLSNMSLLELLRGIRDGFTVHGFRSTFRDWAGDRTNYPRDLIETALAHVIEDDTEAAYRRLTAIQKRRRLMADWARYCASPPAKRSNVVDIGKGRSGDAR